MKSSIRSTRCQYPDAIEPVETITADTICRSRPTFSATEIANPTRLDTEPGRSLPQDSRISVTAKPSSTRYDSLAETQQNPSSEDLTKA